MNRRFITGFVLALALLGVAATFYDPIQGQLVKIFQGATAEAAGKAGVVPAPAAGEQGYVLTGNADWTDLSTLGTDTLATVTARGATTTTAVTVGGLTVAPATATDDTLALTPAAGGAARFAGSVTSSDLTAARAWTLPNASGTVAVSATAPATLSALGDIGVTVAGDIVAGVGLTGGADNVLPGADADVTLTFSAAELNALTWGTGAEAAFIWGFDVSGTDTAITFGNGTINVSTGALQVAGAPVVTDATACTDIEGTGLTITAGTLNVDDVYVLTSGDTMTGALVIEHADGVELGKNAATNTAGTIKLWGAGANDYYATLTAPILTSNAAYKLPVDEPAGTYLLNMTATGQIGYDTKTYQPSASSETLIAGAIQSGTNGTGGMFAIYNELGATDYTVAIQPSASQAGSYTLTLPVALPASDMVLQSTNAGVLSWVANGAAEADTLATVTGRGASTATSSTFSGGLIASAAAGEMTVGDGTQTNVEVAFNVSGTDGTLTWSGASSELISSGHLTSQGGYAYLGTNGANGVLYLYSEQGATDRNVTLRANAAMTSNAVFYLPADEPAGESWLTMGADGIIDYTTIANETLAAVTARGGTTSVQCSFTNGSAMVIGDGTEGVDYAVTWTGKDSSGVVRWMEDEARFDLDAPLYSGKNGRDGGLTIYSEQGETDYTVVFQPAAAMTASTTYTLPTALGAAGTVLTDAAGDGVLSWAAAGGAGTIGGSTGSTDNAILRADGTGGVTLQASAATLSDLSVLAIAGNATNAAGISLAEDTDDGTNTVTIQAQTMDASYTLTLPTSDGAAGEVLKTDGSGVLSWVDLPTSDHAIATAASDTTVDTDDQKIVVLNHSSDPDDNTLVLYKMDGTSGAQVFTDATGHTTATVTGDMNTATPPATHGTGFAQAGYSDGTGDRIHTDKTTYSTVGSENFTLECWFYPTAQPQQPGGYGIVCGFGNSDDVNFDGGIYYYDGGTRLSFYCNGIGDTIYTATSVTLNAWYHVAAVRNGSTVTLYLNGAVADSDTISGTVNSGSTRFLIGDFYTTGASVNSITGYVDEVRLSNVARWVAAFDPGTAPYGGADPMYDPCDIAVTSLVVGPASATDNAVARFNLTTGKLVQNSSVTIDDDGHLDTSGKITGLVRVTAYTSTGNIAAQDCRGGIVTNTGAGGAVVLTLPDAVQGMSVMVILTAAQDVDINPQDGEKILILTDAAGDAVSSDATVGSSLTLIAVSATEWMPVGQNGTWTDAN